jgi:hypothetical protein
MFSVREYAMHFEIYQLLCRRLHKRGNKYPTAMITWISGFRMESCHYSSGTFSSLFVASQMKLHYGVTIRCSCINYAYLCKQILVTFYIYIISCQSFVLVAKVWPIGQSMSDKRYNDQTKTDNSTTMIYNTLLRKRKIKLHEHPLKKEWGQVFKEDFQFLHH